jgi:FixJ family two-component response regulator
LLADVPTVFVIDDDPLIRSLIELLVRKKGTPFESFASAGDFLARFDREQPGCLICDICMPGMSGLELQEELNRRSVSLPVIFISGQGDVPTAVSAMRQGAFDFLLKPFSEPELLQRVEAALTRDRQTRLSQKEMAAIRTRWDSLTPRELEVLQRLVRGMSNKSIGEDLSLSIRTIEVHRAHIMEKMQADSLAQLVRMMMELESSQTQTRG